MLYRSHFMKIKQRLKLKLQKQVEVLIYKLYTHTKEAKYFYNLILRMSRLSLVL